MQKLYRILFLTTLASQVFSSDFFGKKQKNYEDKYAQKALDKKRRTDRNEKKADLHDFDACSKRVRASYLKSLNGKSN